MSNSPRYDQKIRRNGGYMWASECDLECLQYWMGVASRPSNNPQYAEQDKARAKKLSYWVQFREAVPYERWKGVRGDREVVALQPSNKPAIHSWDAPAEPKTEPAPPPEQGDAWEAEDPIPF